MRFPRHAIVAARILLATGLLAVICSSVHAAEPARQDRLFQIKGAASLQIRGRDLEGEHTWDLGQLRDVEFVGRTREHGSVVYRVIIEKDGALWEHTLTDVKLHKSGAEDGQAVANLYAE